MATGSTLASFAALLLGESWQRPLARLLDVDDRLVRRWAKGERPVPGWVWQRFANEFSKRATDLNAALLVIEETMGYKPEKGEYAMPAVRTSIAKRDLLQLVNDRMKQIDSVRRYDHVVVLQQTAVDGSNWDLPVASGRDINPRTDEKAEELVRELKSYLTVVDQVWERQL